MFQTTKSKISAGIAFAGVLLATTMIRPSVSKAITMVEMPAMVFPAISVLPGESLQVCTNNLTGDGSVRALIGLLSVADSGRFLPGSLSPSGSYETQRGSCVLLLPAVMPTSNGFAAVPRTGIPVIYLASGNGGNAGRGLVASVQLVTADGSVRVVTTPTLVDKVFLPAVQ